MTTDSSIHAQRSLVVSPRGRKGADMTEKLSMHAQGTTNLWVSSNNNNDLPAWVKPLSPVAILPKTWQLEGI